MNMYFQRVQQCKSSILVEILDQPWQPKGGVAVYVTSVTNEQRGTTGGRVMSAPVPLAAKLLVDGTHRLSTEEEFRDFRGQEAIAKQRMRSADLVR